MTRTCQNISHLVNQFYYYWLSFWLCWEMMYELMICQDWVRYYSCSQGYQLQLIFHLFRPPFIVSGLQKMVFLLKIECTQKTWCEINNDEKLRLTINQSIGLVNLNYTGIVSPWLQNGYSDNLQYSNVINLSGIHSGTNFLFYFPLHIGLANASCWLCRWPRPGQSIA